MNLEARGYVKDVKKKTGNGKEYCQFRLSVLQKTKDKDKNEVKTYVSVYVTHFGDAPPEDGYVTVKGWLTVQNREKDGKTYTNLNLLTDRDGGLEIQPDKDGGSSDNSGGEAPDPSGYRGAAKKAGKAAKEEKDPWD